MKVHVKMPEGAECTISVAGSDLVATVLARLGASRDHRSDTGPTLLVGPDGGAFPPTASLAECNVVRGMTLAVRIGDGAVAAGPVAQMALTLQCPSDPMFRVRLPAAPERRPELPKVIEEDGLAPIINPPECRPWVSEIENAACRRLSPVATATGGFALKARPQPSAVDAGPGFEALSPTLPPALLQREYKQRLPGVATGQMIARDRAAAVTCRQIASVARMWRISLADAAELIRNVEAASKDRSLSRIPASSVIVAG